MSEIEKETGLPRELWGKLAPLYEGIYTRARIEEVDRVFIERGFATVRAQIEVCESLYGQNSYSVLVEQQAHPKNIDEWRNISDAIHNELCNYEDQGKPKPQAYLERILADSSLSCWSKSDLLQRHFPDQYAGLKAIWLEKMQSAQLEEERLVCTLWGVKPRVRLFEKDKISLREEVMNNVLADAFGALGFEKRLRRSGVDVLHKVLSPKYAIIVAPDIHSLHCESRDSELIPGQFWGLTLDYVVYLGNADKKDNTMWFGFRPSFFSPAAIRCRRYHDTPSLEAAIRP